MCRFNVLLLLYTAFTVSECHSPPATTHSPPATTTHWKRDGQPVTLNVGDLKKYLQTTAGVSAPTGNNLLISPPKPTGTTVPDSGISIAFGPDLQSNLKATVEEYCKEITADTCLSAINQAISDASNAESEDLQARVAPVFVVGAIVAYVVAGIVAIAAGDNAQLSELHFGAADLSSFSSAAAGATAVLLATATNDASPVLVPIDPTAPPSSASPTGAPSFTGNGTSPIIAQDGGWEITLNTTADQTAANDYLTSKNTTGICLAVLLKRNLDPNNYDGLEERDNTATVECMVNSARDILKELGIGGSLHGLAEGAMQLSVPLPQFANDNIRSAFSEFIGWGVGSIANILPGITPESGANVISFAFIFAIVEGYNLFFDSRKTFLEAKSLLSESQKFELICKPYEKAFGKPYAKSPWCQGKKSGNSWKCTTAWLKPCPCLMCPTKPQDLPICTDCWGQFTGTCEIGEQLGCPCMTFPDVWSQPGDPKWLKEQARIIEEVGTCDPGDCGAPSRATPAPAPFKQPSGTTSCPKDECGASLVPANVWNGIYKTFCNAVNKHPSVANNALLNSLGKALPLLNKREIGPRGYGLLRGRTPPPDPGKYEGFEFGFVWTGNSDNGTHQKRDCAFDCGSVYSDFAVGECGTEGGQQNMMATQGEFDTGCGVYTFTITPPPDTPKCSIPSSTPSATPTAPPTKPTIGPLVCSENGGTKCPWLGSMRLSAVKQIIGFMVANPGQLFHPNTPNITEVWLPGSNQGRGGGGFVYLVNIGWIPGCKLYASQVPDNPLGVSGDNTENFAKIILSTYTDCRDNSGTGGYRDVGCLRYGFYPSAAPGLWNGESAPDSSKYWAIYPQMCLNPNPRNKPHQAASTMTNGVPVPTMPLIGIA